MAKEGLQIEMFDSDNYHFRDSGMRKAISQWLADNEDMEVVHVLQNIKSNDSIIITFFVRYPKATGGNN